MILAGSPSVVLHPQEGMVKDCLLAPSGAKPGREAALQLAAWLERAKAAEAAELAAAATKTADALKSLAARRETAPAE